MKIIQLMGVGSSLFALTDEGILWEFDVDKRQWSEHQEIEPNIKMEPVSPEASIIGLELPARIHNALQEYGVMTIGSLVELTTDDIIRIPRLGDKSRFELKKTLVELKKMM